MAQRRAILNKKKATQKIRKITNAMAIIASGRLQRLRKRLLAAEPYVNKLHEMVEALAENVRDLDHPLLRQASVKDSAGCAAFLVITSTRGLAGAYNSNVLRMASDSIREWESGGHSVELYVKGKKGASYFAFRKRPMARRFDSLGEMPTNADMAEAAMWFIDRFCSGKIDMLKVAYSKFMSIGDCRPALVTLLPTRAKRETAANASQASTLTGQFKSAVGYEFSPDPSDLLGELLPLAVQSDLRQCLLNAATSESAARRVAMTRATASADKLSRSLSLRYNRARQDHITTELMDIIGATEAFRNR